MTISSASTSVASADPFIPKMQLDHNLLTKLCERGGLQIIKGPSYMGGVYECFSFVHSLLLAWLQSSRLFLSRLDGILLRNNFDSALLTFMKMRRECFAQIDRHDQQGAKLNTITSTVPNQLLMKRPVQFDRERAVGPVRHPWKIWFYQKSGCRSLLSCALRTRCYCDRTFLSSLRGHHAAPH